MRWRLRNSAPNSQSARFILVEIQRRHFFHLPLESAAPESWSRVVEEGNGTFTFAFFWARPSEVPHDVYPGHDAFFEDIFRVLRSG